MTKKSKQQLEFEQKIGELTFDLQRTRADFENYRKSAESQRENARELGMTSTILKLLPVIDNIERAVTHIPPELAENTWVKGIAGLVKSLDKSLEGMNLKKINAAAGEIFNPELHDAVQVDEESVGEQEIIVEELQPGYLLNDHPIRHAMVKVARK